jgi:hypothetical protein
VGKNEDCPSFSSKSPTEILLDPVVKAVNPSTHDTADGIVKTVDGIFVWLDDPQVFAVCEGQPYPPRSMELAPHCGFRGMPISVPN